MNTTTKTAAPAAPATKTPAAPKAPGVPPMPANGKPGNADSLAEERRIVWNQVDGLRARIRAAAQAGKPAEHVKLLADAVTVRKDRIAVLNGELKTLKPRKAAAPKAPQTAKKAAQEAAQEAVEAAAAAPSAQVSTKVTKLTKANIQALQDTKAADSLGATFAVFNGSPQEALDRVQTARQKAFQTLGGKHSVTTSLVAVRNKLAEFVKTGESKTVTVK